MTLWPPSVPSQHYHSLSYFFLGDNHEPCFCIFISHLSLTNVIRKHNVIMDSKSYTVSYNLSPVTLRAYDTNNDHDNNYNDNDERIKTDDVL